jgi:hypothetical protein
LQVR